ncbi:MULTISPECIES: hypothetical protein [unclassified Pseudoalteromonas]|uniref:hypothetical protein n=1 Tax=unclassified Pseudoalteromonas TaxID=194690 RepID=UPI000C088A3E|nr:MULTISPECIES: hypothetical protein [unclassified Pseudoalteromonas]MDP2634625.1 hypothetical protein [Pseudoalteromonas sp. 1_MG-2023]PHN91163.1 hypothetical protein CSC79_02590 [Pseudoalteromonas sp. 3D05]
MKQYSVVKITELNTVFKAHENSFGSRSPRVGDIATILDVYEDAYDLECSDSDGVTIWLEMFNTSDATFELIE